MNFPDEHHGYAAVPCYRLGKPHKLIRRDLPANPRGLLAAWLQILKIQRRRKANPDFRFRAVQPAPALTERPA